MQRVNEVMLKSYVIKMNLATKELKLTLKKSNRQKPNFSMDKGQQFFQKRKQTKNYHDLYKKLHQVHDFYYLSIFGLFIGSCFLRLFIYST